MMYPVYYRAATPNGSRRGFTLMEIVIATVILGLLMAVAMPAMKGMNEKNKLRSDARELVSLIKLARTEAVFNERTTQIFLDLEKGQFWLDLREPTEKGERRGKNDRKIVEQVRDLEPKIWFEETQVVQQNILKDNVIAIDFYPDGSASPTFITLANTSVRGGEGDGEGARMTIEVLKSTGQVELTPGTIAGKQEAALNSQPVTPGGAGAPGA